MTKAPGATTFNFSVMAKVRGTTKPTTEFLEKILLIKYFKYAYLWNNDRVGQERLKKSDVSKA